MRVFLRPLLCPLALTIAACGPEVPTTADIESDKPLYVTLDDDLTQFKADFNAMTDKVRLVFISGPSCGICLRGLDDLNRAIVASAQRDPRMHTLVLHVPTLDAEEKHTVASIPLMYGPRISHYWDPGGQSGREFQEALDIRMYAWDVWMVYEPGAAWEPDQPPPPPDYWEHQLGPLPTETRLDAERFAGVVREKLAALPPATEQARMASVRQLDDQIMSVAQPRGLMIQQNHTSRGGYENLKKIRAIRYEGTTVVDGQSHSVVVQTARPHHYERVVTDGDRVSTVRFDGATVHREGPSLDLPADVQAELLSSYEFDGWMTDWKDKGHQVWRLGMKKYGDRLPWLMEAELTNGRTWHIYVDSHTGDAFRQALIGPNGEETLAVEFGDFRDVDGFRLSHEVRYLAGDRVLGTDRFEHIDIETEAEELKAELGGESR